jgi:hypothetical protein
MIATADAMVKVLDEEGITLLPYDEELSCPEFPSGSIEWLGYYVEQNIGETTGFSPAMYTTVTEKGLCITSILNSKSIDFSPTEPEKFVEEVKQVMKAFYADL